MASPKYLLGEQGDALSLGWAFQQGSAFVSCSFLLPSSLQTQDKAS